MNCPQCQANYVPDDPIMTKVIVDREVKTRRCSECGFSFVTCEIRGERYDELIKYEQGFKEIQRIFTRRL